MLLVSTNYSQNFYSRMTLPIAIEKMNGLINELENSWQPIMVGNTQDALALIEERITTTGMSASGTALKPYTKPYQKFKSNPGEYKRGKQLALGSSRFTGKTDYTLTGEMWKDIQVLDIRESGNTVTCVAGPSKDINRKKMESLTKRDGPPLRLSDAEKEIIITNTRETVKEIIYKYFPK